MLESVVNDHVQFREEHKMFLEAQVLLAGSLEALRDRLATVSAQLATPGEKVDAVRARTWMPG